MCKSWWSTSAWKDATVKNVWTVAVYVGTFAVLEVVCRLVLHLSDSVTPLIVIPLPLAAALLTRRMLGRRADSESPEP
jgi:hypothetical protein